MSRRPKLVAVFALALLAGVSVLAGCGGGMPAVAATTTSHRGLEAAPPAKEAEVRAAVNTEAVPASTDPTERVAFVRGGSLWMMAPDGRELSRLTTRGASAPDGMPALSPRGDAIAFVSARDGAAKLYVLPIGGAPRAVTDGADGGDAGPAWSPDGGKLVFVRGRPTDRRDLYLVDLDGGAPPRLLVAGADDEPAWVGGAAWSPDGRTIAFAADRRDGMGTALWLVGADGLGLRRLTQAPRPMRWMRDVRPAWSPDGAHLVFASNRHASAESEAGDLDLYTVAVGDGAITRLTHDPGVADDPCYSPDGRRIVFTSTRDAVQPFSVELFVMPAAGGEQRRLTRDAVPQNSAPACGRVGQAAPAR